MLCGNFHTIIIYFFWHHTTPQCRFPLSTRSHPVYRVLRVKNVGKAKPETNLKKQPYMKKYVIILAVGGAIHFAGCGGPSEDPDALGKGEPAIEISDEDRKAAEKMGIKFDPNNDVKTNPDEEK